MLCNSLVEDIDISHSNHQNLLVNAQLFAISVILTRSMNKSEKYFSNAHWLGNMATPDAVK